MGVKQSIRLGAGSGFAGDRIDPAVELARHGQLDYLIFECLGERTVADGQLRRKLNPEAGYDPFLEQRISAVIELALESNTTIITNGGSANVLAAQRKVAASLRPLGLRRPVKIAALTGDDVLTQVRALDPNIWENNKPVSAFESDLVSANAYIGADALVEALAQDADVVIAGRVADPSLYLAPMIYEFGWSANDYSQLGKGTCVGHLLECAGQLTGGYFADPGKKDVPDLANLGFPFADVERNGHAVLGKLNSSGGLINVRTCREQLLYEVSTPQSYLTPDVTADFSRVKFTNVGMNRVSVDGASGTAKPEQLKVSLGFRGGWMAEGQISYGGPRSKERAQLAGQVVCERMEKVHGIPSDSLVIELIGTGSVFRGSPGRKVFDLQHVPEVRLRVSGVFKNEECARKLNWEVESLYTNGPAGGGGSRASLREVISIRSTSLPRDAINTSVHVVEA